MQLNALQGLINKGGEIVIKRLVRSLGGIIDDRVDFEAGYALEKLGVKWLGGEVWGEDENYVE